MEVRTRPPGVVRLRTLAAAVGLALALPLLTPAASPATAPAVAPAAVTAEAPGALPGGLAPVTAPAATTTATAAAPLDIRLRRPFAVDPSSRAMAAARTDATFRTIANRPQARWYTESLAVDKAQAAASSWGTYAVSKGATPLVTIYALPGRDCGSHSGGGLDARTYRLWIEQIALGLRGKGAVAVLEPDALGLLGTCAGQEQWIGLLRYATYTLARYGTWVYIDAGHSNWRSATEMATRLEQAGVQWARGFATNVSNFRRTDAEIAYGQQVVTALGQLGLRDKRYLVDTSRNGAGPAADGSVCNPASARVGAAPRILNSRGLDFVAWVKRPGESDGRCGGGPAAGQWWALGAKRLLGKA